MGNDLTDSNKGSLSGLIHEVYRDVAQPSVRRVGVSFETISKLALSPVTLMDWGFEQSKEWLKAKIASRQSSTPTECQAEPTTNILHLALSHIAVSNDTPELRELYAELLLKAMDSRTVGLVHPAYFHVIEQLAPEEALILVGLYARKDEVLFNDEAQPFSATGRSKGLSIEEQFSRFCASVLGRPPTHPDVWLTNLCRLGLLVLDSYTESVFSEAGHDRHGYHPPGVANHEHRDLNFTGFGTAFISACAPLPPDQEQACAERR